MMARRGPLLAIILGLLLAIPYFQLVRYGVVLETDDHRLLDPIWGAYERLGFWGAIGSYPTILKEGSILEVQPLRDLDYLIDCAASKILTGSPSAAVHHLGSLVWMALFGWLAFGILGTRLEGLHQTRSGSERSSALHWLLWCWIMTHPALHSATAWISGRKHLMAATLITWATLLLFKALTQTQRPRPTGIVISYLAAVLSQPMPALWPFWASTFVFKRGAQRLDNHGPVRRALIACLLLAVAALAFQFFYYRYGFSAKSGFDKFQGTWSVSEWLQSVGRYTLNLLAPIQVGLRYFPGDRNNWIGLVLAITILIATLKALTRPHLRSVALALLWVPLSLAPVLAFKTNIFVMDNYLVYSLPIVAWAGLEIIRSRPPAHKNACIVALLVLIGAQSVESFKVISSFQNDRVLWERATTAVPTEENLVTWILNLLSGGEPGKAWELLPKLKDHPSYAELHGRTLYQATWMEAPEKIPLLESFNTSKPNSWTLYYLAALKVQLGRSQQGWQDMERALKLDPSAWGASAPQIAAEAEWMCKGAQGNGCNEILSKLRNSSSSWDEERYTRRAQELPEELQGER